MSHITQEADRTLISINAGADAAAVKATLAELVKNRFTLKKPFFADETSVREAVLHAASADELEAVRGISTADPATRVAFYRHVPAAAWNGSQWCHPLAWSMAFARGVVSGMPSSAAASLSADVAHMTDAELDALVAAILSEKVQDIHVHIQGADGRLFTRLFARLDDAKLDAFWAKQRHAAWALIPGLADPQLIALWTRRDPKANDGGALRFEMLRRGLYDEARLGRDLELFDGGMAMWSLFAPPPDPDHAFGWTHPAFLRALVTAGENARAFLPRLRAWHARQRPHVTDPNSVKDGAIFLFALVADDESIAWFAKILNEKSAVFRKGYMLESMVKHLGDGLAASPEGEAILAKLAKPLKGKVLGSLVELAKTRLASNRTELGDAPAAQVAWAATRGEDALRLLESSSDPDALVDAAFAGNDPVAQLNALHTGALLEFRRNEAGKARPVEQRLAFAERAIRALDASWSTSTPDGAALRKVIGGPANRAARRFEEALVHLLPVPRAAWEGFVVDVVAPILRASANPTVRLWLEPIVARVKPELVESSHARLVRLAASLAGGGATVRHGFLVKTHARPSTTTVNRLYGPPIGVDASSWPKREGQPMRHLITAETRLFAEPVQKEYAARGVAAVAVFVSSLDAHEAFGPGTDHARIVELSASDLAKGAGEVPGDDAVDAGVALEALSCDLPSAAFAGGAKQAPQLIELRDATDRDDVLMVSRASPRWIQQPQPAGVFLFDLGERFAGALNLGDGGRLFVFAATAFAQSG